MKELIIFCLFLFVCCFFIKKKILKPSILKTIVVILVAIFYYYLFNTLDLLLTFFLFFIYIIVGIFEEIKSGVGDLKSTILILINCIIFLISFFGIYFSCDCERGCGFSFFNIASNIMIFRFIFLMSAITSLYFLFLIRKNKLNWVIILISLLLIIVLWENRLHFHYE